MTKRVEKIINKIIPLLEKLEEIDDESLINEPKDRAIIYQLELRMEWLYKKTNKLILNHTTLGK